MELKDLESNYSERELLRKKIKDERKRMRIEQIIVFLLIIFYFMFVTYIYVFN